MTPKLVLYAFLKEDSDNTYYLYDAQTWKAPEKNKYFITGLRKTKIGSKEKEIYTKILQVRLNSNPLKGNEKNGFSINYDSLIDDAKWEKISGNFILIKNETCAHGFFFSRPHSVSTFRS